MKNKYLSTDKRTGFEEGTLVELTMDELIKVPFNVYMRLVADKSEQDKKQMQKLIVEQAQVDLRKLLLNKGLSTYRIGLVLDKYPTLSAIKANAQSAGIDKVTDDFIKSHFYKAKKKKIISKEVI